MQHFPEKSERIMIEISHRPVPRKMVRSKGMEMPETRTPIWPFSMILNFRFECIHFELMQTTEISASQV